MEAVRDLVDVTDVDVGRQLVVDLAPEHLRGKIRVDLEMGDLCKSVHPGIGPPGSIELELLPARRLPHRAIDFALHRAGILLNLPAAVAGAGIFDEQLEPRHPRILWPWPVDPAIPRSGDPATANCSIVSPCAI